jgi:hypothetical protein
MYKDSISEYVNQKWGGGEWLGFRATDASGWNLPIKKTGNKNQKFLLPVLL